MVHALREIQRVLVKDGVLIDLRPISDRWRIEVVSARETRETGRMTDLPLGLEDDAAANQAMTNAETNGWFKRESGEFFPLHYLWDTASEMEKWADEEWEDFIGLEEEARQRHTFGMGSGRWRYTRACAGEDV